MEVLSIGYWIPFSAFPTLSKNSILFDSCFPRAIRRKALRKELDTLVEKEVVELALASPSYYSQMFEILKASEAWIPILALSVLNCQQSSPAFMWKHRSLC